MTIDRDELRRLHEAATPPPWQTWDHWHGQYSKGISCESKAYDVADVTYLKGDTKGESVANAALIAYLRNHAAAILAELETKDALVTAMERIQSDLEIKVEQQDAEIRRLRGLLGEVQAAMAYQISVRVALHTEAAEMAKKTPHNKPSYDPAGRAWQGLLEADRDLLAKLQTEAPHVL